MPSARAILLGLALLLAAVPAQAQRATLPGIVGADDRRVVEPREYPWSAVGRLNTSVGQRCTGTLVGPRLVATAAHCLFNRRTRQPLRPEAVHFLAGYGRGEWAAMSQATAIRRGIDGPPGDPARDWALVTLAEPIGNRVGWIAPGPAPGDGQATILRAGYGQDRAHLPMAVLGCRIRAAPADRPLLVHDCDAVRGDSGSAILAVQGGRVSLVGIHAGHGQQQGQTIGIAVAARAFRDTVADWPDSRPPTAGAGVDPVPTDTVRTLARRLGRPVPPASLEALARLAHPAP